MRCTSVADFETMPESVINKIVIHSYNDSYKFVVILAAPKNRTTEL